jgi:hypothetical protein
LGTSIYFLYGTLEPSGGDQATGTLDNGGDCAISGIFQGAVPAGLKAGGHQGQPSEDLGVEVAARWTATSAARAPNSSEVAGWSGSPEALVDKEQQLSVELEEKLSILSGKQHPSGPLASVDFGAQPIRGRPRTKGGWRHGTRTRPKTDRNPDRSEKGMMIRRRERWTTEAPRSSLGWP